MGTLVLQLQESESGQQLQEAETGFSPPASRKEHRRVPWDCCQTSHAKIYEIKNMGCVKPLWSWSLVATSAENEYRYWKGMVARNILASFSTLAENVQSVPVKRAMSMVLCRCPFSSIRGFDQDFTNAVFFPMGMMTWFFTYNVFTDPFTNATPTLHHWAKHHSDYDLL